jgi:hypothetical protein
MDEEDKKLWRKFRSVKKNTVTHEELVMISELHALYFKHTYYKPALVTLKKLRGGYKI